MESHLTCWCKGAFAALVIAAFLDSVFAYTDPVEVKALKSFRDKIGDPMNHLSNWKGDDPCGSQWNGVVCLPDDKDIKKQHVHELHLLNMNLTGTLAPDLSNLKKLYILDMMWNKISGSIPPEIGNLSNLYLLLLNGNNLTGTLPSSLGNLFNLNRLQIDQNRISGPVPKSFANLNKAVHFHMNNNSLNGSIPKELGSLQNLAHLLLDNNDLSGPLPPELSNISTLLILQLDNNHFTGEIPRSYSSMYNLTKLSLRNCSLNGTILDVTNLQHLANLDLSHNNLEGLLPSGKVFDNLITMDLSFNELSGSIPIGFSELPHLQNLVLRNNMLNGTVPEGFGSGIPFSSSPVLLLDFQNNNISNNNLTDYNARNISLGLYGNPWCIGKTNSMACVPSDSGINDIFPSSVSQNGACSENICDPALNQELLVLESGLCLCSSPLTVVYRLKSPSFVYFPPYTDEFENYLSSWMNLSKYQVNVSSSMWVPGPRLRMIIKLFPDNMSHQFTSSQVERLYVSLTDWLIPNNDTFGPYEILSFAIQFPYNLKLITKKSNSVSTETISAIVCGSIALTAMVVAVAMFLFMKKRRQYFGITLKKSGRAFHRDQIKVSGVKNFTFDEMAVASNNFSNSMQVGQGGYGKVYRGTLTNGKEVAIKRAQEGSLQGSKEFYTEIELLSRVHHRNLVSLIGYCDDEGEQMLVYEYMANGTLHDHLSSRANEPIDFRTRLQIALGAARGILYLHTEANPPIYHRDIKASNILLDDKNKAKVADFGLSRLAPISDLEGAAPGHVSTVVKGTPGYLDPEYFLTHKLTDKSDVYSFGVVLLELITGMQPISHGKNIVREANLVYEAGMMLSIVDPHMGSYPSEALEPLVRLAIACCKDDTDARPSMAEVVRDLEDIWRNTPWSDSMNSFDTSEMEVNELKSIKMPVQNDPYTASYIDRSDLMSGTIPNVVPR